MTTDYVDVTLPDELPERTSSWVGKIVDMGFANPPEKKAATIRGSGGQVRPELHSAIQPLSFRYESDRSLFENDLEDRWIPVFNKNGDLNGKGSMLDDVKRSFKALGYDLNSNSDCRKLIGKVFRFATTEKKFGEGWTGKPVYVVLPQEEIDPSAYVAPSPLPVRYRPPKRDSAPIAGAAGAAFDENAARDGLVKALTGKAPADFLTAIMESKNPAIIRDPFITEAVEKDPMIQRVAGYGLVLTNGVLTDAS